MKTMPPNNARQYSIEPSRLIVCCMIIDTMNIVFLHLHYFICTSFNKPEFLFIHEPIHKGYE